MGYVSAIDSVDLPFILHVTFLMGWQRCMFHAMDGVRNCNSKSSNGVETNRLVGLQFYNQVINYNNMLHCLRFACFLLGAVQIYL